jgi:hypothetical protein
MFESMYGERQIGGLGAYLGPECHNFWSSLLCGGALVGFAGLTPDGWRNWIGDTPPEGKLIQWWREEWDKPTTGYSHEINPYANINGLYWRLTGIGKEGL